ncbi:serine/threonine-protein kinase [Streptomyces sp. NPDC001156]
MDIVSALLRRTDPDARQNEGGSVFEHGGHRYTLRVIFEDAPGQKLFVPVGDIPGRNPHLGRWVLLLARSSGGQLSSQTLAKLPEDAVVLDQDHLEAAIAGLQPLAELVHAAYLRGKLFTPLTDLLVRDPGPEPFGMTPSAHLVSPVSAAAQAASGVSARLLLVGTAQAVRPLGMAYRSEQLVLTTERGVAEVDTARGLCRWLLPLPGCYGSPLVRRDGSFLVLCGSALVRWHQGALTVVAGAFEPGSVLLAGPEAETWVLSGSGATFGAGASASTLALTRAGEALGGQLRYAVGFPATVLSAGWLEQRRFFLAASGSSTVVDLGRSTGVGSREEWIDTAGHYPAHLLVTGRNSVVTASADGSGNRVSVYRTDVLAGTSECLAEARLGDVFGLTQSPDGSAYLLGSVPTNDPHLVQPVVMRITGHRPRAESAAEPAVQTALAGVSPVLRLPAYEQVRQAARGTRADYALERLPFDGGGQGEVFRATHKPTGVVVVFKRRSSSWSKTMRMHREIEIAQRLGANPHVMPVLDFSPDHTWFVMPLAEATAEERQMELQRPKELRALVDAVTSVLAEAHAHGTGWLHRDIKPANILLLDGRWRLADWGLVRRPLGQTTEANRTGAGLGSPGFAAPELSVDAHHAGFASDIYSLGQVIGWILTGRAPQPNVPLLPPPSSPWRSVVRAATHLDPRLRPQTVAEFRALIERELDEPPQLPIERAEALLAESPTDPAAADAFLDLIASNPDDYELYLHILPELAFEHAAPALSRHPQQGIDLARAMAGHVHGDGRNRVEFYEADRAVAWLHRVAADAARTESWDLLDEAIRAMCTWDGAWDQWQPQDDIRPWLGSLHGDAAGIAAAGLRDHPDCARHFSSLAEDRTVDRRIRSAIHVATAQR